MGIRVLHCLVIDPIGRLFGGSGLIQLRGADFLGCGARRTFHFNGFNDFVLGEFEGVVLANVPEQSRAAAIGDDDQGVFANLVHSYFPIFEKRAKGASERQSRHVDLIAVPPKKIVHGLRARPSDRIVNGN